MTNTNSSYQIDPKVKQLLVDLLIWLRHLDTDSSDIIEQANLFHAQIQGTLGINDSAMDCFLTGSGCDDE